MKKAILLMIIPILFSCTRAESPEQKTAVSEKPELPTDWYTEAKFGMFIHWGLYAELAGIWENQRYYGIGEWIMKRAQIPAKEYEKVADIFNPVKFNAEDWVLQAKNAGMKYIVITSKHHDGFAMFHSKVCPFNIVDATPFKRDPLRELADACKKHGIKLGFYYSQTQDWYERNATGNDWDYDPAKKNFDEYLEKKVKPQLTELLTHYGDLGILWFDTPQDITPDESLALVNWVHNLQPACLTTSRVGNGYGDYLTLGDHQIPDTIINKPFEVLFTHNDSWGYTHFDKNFRSSKEIIRILAETLSKGGNFLLNIGPQPDGTFPPESSRMLNEVGEWINKNKESVYGSSFSPFPNLTWGFCTSKPGAFYFHVLHWPENGILRIPDIAKNSKSATILSSGQELKYKVAGNDIIVSLPLIAPDPLSTVIKVEYTGEPLISDIMTIMEGYPVSMSAHSSHKAGNTTYNEFRWMEEFGDWKYASYIGGWKSPDDYAKWTFKVNEPGTYKLVLDYAYLQKKGSAEGLIEIGDQKLYFETLHTGNELFHYRDHEIGNVRFENPGVEELVITPLTAQANDEFILLRSVKLMPL